MRRRCPAAAARRACRPKRRRGSNSLPAIWDPLGPEPPPVAADLVVGLGTGAALRAGTALPSALRQAVAPGGAMLLAEPLPGRVWDFCCGQDPAWWTAPGGSALLGAAAWAEALTAAGWDAPSPVPLGAAPWPAALIAARAPAGAAVLAAPTLRRVALFADAGATALRDRLAAALTARGATVSNGDLADAALRAARRPPGQPGGGARRRRGRDRRSAGREPRRSRPPGRRGGGQRRRLPPGDARRPAAGRRRPRPPPAEGAACFALGRVLANEHPGAPAPTHGHLSRSLSPDAAARRLVPELLHEPRRRGGGDADR